jgi:hypothetical protein
MLLPLTSKYLVDEAQKVHIISPTSKKIEEFRINKTIDNSKGVIACKRKNSRIQEQQPRSISSKLLTSPCLHFSHHPLPYHAYAHNLNPPPFPSYIQLPPPYFRLNPNSSSTTFFYSRPPRTAYHPHPPLPPSE